MSELPKDETVPPVEEPATSVPAVVEPAEAPAPDANKLVAPAGWEPTFPDDAPKIQVKFIIQDFDGPLDLELHLIRKNQMDIKIIPIAPITRCTSWIGETTASSVSLTPCTILRKSP